MLFGVPLGLAFTACSVATLAGVASRDAGLASGLNNTFEQAGGAIGTALMIATARTGDLLHAGAGHLFALDRGIQLAFATAIAFPVLGVIVSLLLLPRSRPAVAIEPLRATAANGDTRRMTTSRKVPSPSLPPTITGSSSGRSQPAHVARQDPLVFFVGSLRALKPRRATLGHPSTVPHSSSTARRRAEFRIQGVQEPGGEHRRRRPS